MKESLIAIRLITELLLDDLMKPLNTPSNCNSLMGHVVPGCNSGLWVLFFGSLKFLLTLKKRKRRREELLKMKPNVF